MYNYLLKHAIDNVWCNNEQDNQLIIKPHKISNPIGAINVFRLMNRYIDLPVTNVRCHVYQIGQLHPKILGLLSRNPGWVNEVWWTFKDAINSLKVFCNIYTKEGLELPRYKTHYMFTNEKDLIIAIEEDSNYPLNFQADDIFLRVYSNAYFQSLRSDQNLDYLYCDGRKVVSNDDILNFQTIYNTYKLKHGYTFCYKNGYLIDGINLVNVAIGDTVEILYDSSVKRLVTFTVNDLLTFNSELDNKYKYLLHYSDGSDITDDIIDYQDDIDIHILKYLDVNKYTGLYYHRNNINSHRMVTHKDYSVVVDYFNYIANSLNPGSDDIRNYKIQVKVRQSGYYRPLIFDNNRIFELYKLSEDKLIQAMVGVNATVLEWQASNLEKSAYTEIMRSEYRDINLDLIQRGYGYNSISKIIADTPVKTITRSGLQSADLPYELMDNSTVYEYDENGYLLGYFYHLTGSEYNSINPDTRMLEVISGRGTYQPDVIFGTDNISLPTVDNYRVYMCYVVNNIPNEEWKDITDSELYTVVDNTLIWNNLETNQYLMVRTDNTFLAYNLDLNLVGGLLYFTLAEMEERDGELLNHTLPVPLGELDIFLNGKSLIRGLDYIVNFPNVYITSKNHLNMPAESSTQQLTIRFTGFANKDLTLDNIEDYGYIQHGFLSNNNKYDIRDDKVLRITVNGSLKHRDDILFSELHDGVSIVNPINGNPYQIKDIVVPLKQLVNENTYSLRDKSIQIDKRISDYLTVYLPQPPRDALSSIYERYPIVSPFMARIITDLINDVILPDIIIDMTNDNAIMQLCSSYEYLLKYDPINPDLGYDYNYIIVHPIMNSSVVEVSVYEYRFLLRVIAIYCRGLVDISSFVTLTNSGV